MNNVKDRIQEYLDKKKISIYRLERDAELSKGYWGKTKSISADIASKISRLYADISPTWLLLGEGEMILDNSEKPLNSSDEFEIKSLKAGHHEERIIKKLESEIEYLRQQNNTLLRMIEEKNNQYPKIAK